VCRFHGVRRCALSTKRASCRLPSSGLCSGWKKPRFAGRPTAIETTAKRKPPERIGYFSTRLLARREEPPAHILLSISCSAASFVGCPTGTERASSADGRDDLLQSDRHAAAHGVGVGICRLRANCRTAEGTAGIPSVVRPKQQGHYSSRSHEAAQLLWTVGHAGKCLGMGSGRR
jgi:hypothetical protein